MKNFVMISPSYPQRLYFFADRLKKRGLRVFGAGDQDFWSLSENLRSDLTEYCRTTLNCYDDNGNPGGQHFDYVRDALGYLQGKYGKLDYIESFNEWWLPLDAALRDKFGVEGVHPEQLIRLTRKSLMKECFAAAGVEVAPGQILGTLPELLEFLSACGNDIVVKPDRGVGASDTYRLRSEQEAREFFERHNPHRSYFIEKFVDAPDRELLSFDGLAGEDGTPLFYTAHKYSSGIMEIVGGNPLSYWSYKSTELPAGLKEAGLAALKSFGLKKSFFHIEFFKTGGRIIGLEINARPPGVLTLDMINHAKGIDCWDLYAAMCAGDKPEYKPHGDDVSAYTARLYDGRDYLLTHEDVLARFGGEIVFHMPMDSRVMGDYAYLLKTSSQQRCFEIISEISATRQA
ncbi:MAG: hypothetical protein GX410_11350 [Elusimicrobia bacterium]|nr:hypothetical protein [Elusimicrobiota bacterium]